MDKELQLSIVVPVYNRPGEIGELLESLCAQTDPDFEILIVEDGSTLDCEEVCRQYSEKLQLNYLFKPNSGRSDSRNYGMERARGNYFLIFDSDCLLPPDYIQKVRTHLREHYLDCYGGPDKAAGDFTNRQKAINYAMTSFLTTGGIRGGDKKKASFTPRSFNMGISKEVFRQVGGFKNIVGEDIDLSIRIKKAGFSTGLLSDAFVYHKRRVDLKSFYRQVKTFGKGRVLISRMHPGSMKLLHLLPLIFVLVHVLLLLLSLVFLNPWFLLPLPVYMLILFIDSLFKNKHAGIAALSVLAAYIQLFGYGLGLGNELLTKKAYTSTQEELYK